jgi:hypothetical protein
MNGESGLDIVSMTEEISDIAVDAFKKFLSTFEFLDMKKRDTPKQLKTLILSINNKFYNYPTPSSNRYECLFI